jgi:hypothetical protein
MCSLVWLAILVAGCDGVNTKIFIRAAPNKLVSLSIGLDNKVEHPVPHCGALILNRKYSLRALLVGGDCLCDALSVLALYP